MAVVMGLLAIASRSGGSATFSAASAARPSPRSAAPKSPSSSSAKLQRPPAAARPAARPADLARAGARAGPRPAGARPADRRRPGSMSAPAAAARHLAMPRSRSRSPTDPNLPDADRSIRPCASSTGHPQCRLHRAALRRRTAPAHRCAAKSSARSPAISAVPKTMARRRQPVPERGAQHRIRRARPRTGRRHPAADRRRSWRSISTTAKSCSARRNTARSSSSS